MATRDDKAADAPLWCVDEPQMTPAAPDYTPDPVASQATVTDATTVLGDARGLGESDRKAAGYAKSIRRATDLFFTKTTGEGLGPMASPLRFAENIIKGDDVGDAVFRTAAQEAAVTPVRAAAPRATLGGGVSLATTAAQIVDPFVPDHWRGLKDVTAGVAAADPAANAAGLASGAYDLVTSLGDGDQLEETRENAVEGDYGVIAQASTLWGGFAAEGLDGPTAKWATGAGAESNPLLRLGNHIGDSLYNNDGNVPLSEAYQTPGFQSPSMHASKSRWR